MHINKSTRFALYAVVELARNTDKKVSVLEISTKYNVSEHHMSKVMQLLARFEMVEAVRGVGGGYQLTGSAKEITVMDVIELVEPQFAKRSCQLKDKNHACDQEGHCSIQELFDEVSVHVIATFSAVSIDNLAKREEVLAQITDHPAP